MANERTNESGPTRRGLLLGAASGAAAAAGVLAASPAKAAGRASKRAEVFVLVHGANGSAGVWSGVAELLAARGHLVFAVDLPGHGGEGWFPAAYQAPQDLDTLSTLVSPLNGVTPADNVAHVVEVVRRAAAHGPVVLVGQSLGGVTITGVADVVPHLVHRLVYLSAFCCTDPARPTLIEYYGTPEGQPSLVLRVPNIGNPDPAGGTGALRNNWRSADPAFFAAAKAAFLADGTDDQMRVLLNSCQPDESILMYYTPITPAAERWGRVRRTFIRLSEDRAIPLPMQDLMIADADRLTPRNKFRVVTVESSHLNWIFHPDAVIGHLTTA
ncbi:alpha/beta hydrolase [Actinoplanes sp. NPDC026623]|uniref:alpha/beta hydrolase n=1 Tax=Actinoplanes sp. NPDC026623 TaxID=3155610 RepID=UPI0033E794CA